MAETLRIETLYRTARVDRAAADPDSRTVRLSFSSEAPVERWFGVEILDHDPGAVRLERLRAGGPLLLDHYPTRVIGVIEQAEIGPDRKGRAVARFGRSALAEEAWQDVLDGIRHSVSVGYRVHRMVEEDEGRYRVVDWEPLEVSLVGVPADASVGVGRGRADETLYEAVVERPPTQKERTEMKTEERREMETAPEEPRVEVTREEPPAEVRELARVKKIMAMGEQFGRIEEAVRAVREGESVEEFKERLVHDWPDPEPAPRPKTEIGLTQQEVRDYSLFRAIRAALSGRWDEEAPFEAECSRAVAEQIGRDPRGFFVPFDVLDRSGWTGQRVMTAGGAGSGAELVGTDHLAGSFIDALRPQTVAMRLGARVLTGLVGDVDIPRLDSGATFYWVTEDADVTSSDATTGSVTLSPKTVGGAVPMSRRLLKQSSPAVEAVIRADLVRGAAIAIDAGALQGSGAAGQPTGVLNTSGINTATVITAGQPTWAEVVAFETALATDNALFGSLAYVTTPAVLEHCKTTEKASGTAVFLSDGGTLNGYPLVATTQVPANTVLFGNFEELLIGMWGTLDVVADKATKAASGGLVLRVFQDVDVAVRHPVSFCKNA